MDTPNKKNSRPPSPEKPCKVLLVDDHPIVRRGLAEILNMEKDVAVCGEAASVAEAWTAIEQQKPDLVVLDILLKEGNGLELMKDLKRRHPTLPVLVVSMLEESVVAERALRAGARGFLNKQEAVKNILTAVREILAGGLYVSEEIKDQIVKRVASGNETIAKRGIERLSDRELEVLQLLGKGINNRQIAQDLHLSVKTVETYREHIKRKLSLRDSVHLVNYATQWVEGRAPSEK